MSVISKTRTIVASNLFARNARQGQIAPHVAADFRQLRSQRSHVSELRSVADLAPTSMIKILLSPLRIAPGGLYMFCRESTNPNVSPSRRNHERTDSPKRISIAHNASRWIDVLKARPRSATANAWIVVVHISQRSRSRRFNGLGEQSLSGCRLCANDGARHVQGVKTRRRLSNGLDRAGRISPPAWRQLAANGGRVRPGSNGRLSHGGDRRSRCFDQRQLAGRERMKISLVGSLLRQFRGRLAVRSKSSAKVARGEW
jgi:hypothetical protein